jgi:hypothetical protein
LLLSGLIIASAAIILPLTIIGDLFQFTEPPWAFFLFLTGLMVAYLLMLDLVKAWFYKRYAQFN